MFIVGGKKRKKIRFYIIYVTIRLNLIMIQT